jgi:hypothetical protein
MPEQGTVRHLTRVAREYCAFIESFDAEEDADFSSFIMQLSQLLPRLHMAVATLADAEATEDLLAGIDPEKRFQLYSRLHSAFGDLDAYWMEFDVGRDWQEQSGSLADDLADIYWELKAGLERLETDQTPLPTLRCWGAGYRLHWGQHLVDAERHLYGLRARRAL